MDAGGDVTVGPHAALRTTGLRAERCNWLQPPPAGEPDVVPMARESLPIVEVMKADPVGSLGAAPLLEGANLVGMTQREPYVVQPVHQAILAEGIDVEPKPLAAVGVGNALFAKIDHETEARKRRRVAEELVDFLRDPSAPVDRSCLPPADTPLDFIEAATAG